MDPRMMKKLQKQMKSEELQVTEVIFRMPGKNLVFKQPSVTAMNLMGQNTYQVIGDPIEVVPGAESGGSGGEAGGGTVVPTGPAIPDEDVKLVAERAGVPESEARAALIKADGDIAEAIISFM